MEIRDVVALIAAIFVIVTVILPMIAKSRARGRGGYVDSIGNLKQIGLAVRLWSDDHGGLPPSMVSTNQGGAMEFVERGSVARYFQVISDNIGTAPVVHCMQDEQRKAATNWAMLKDENISFFIVPEADGKVPELWLAGDRHLATNGALLKPGLFTMPATLAISWLNNLDVKQRNLCYADGHVEKPTSSQLQDSAANALIKYQVATTNASFRLVIP